MQYIIENGLNSIRIGLEDFELAAKNPARLTSAVRNIYAGILILAKGKLYELSPPESHGILIRVVLPKLVDQRLELVPQGNKTINFEEIKKRFRHFRLELDWEKIERIREIRNDLEHFYHDGAPSNVQEALADAATVIRSLLRMHHLDPAHHLSQDCWKSLLRNQELFESELQTCRTTFANIEWLNESAEQASAHFSCQECKSPLIRQFDPSNRQQDKIIAVCRACSHGSDMNSAIEHAVTSQYYRELYEAHTRGGELPVLRCPQCHCDALVYDSGECAVCGYVLTPETHWCEACNNPVSDEEYRTHVHECPSSFDG